MLYAPDTQPIFDVSKIIYKPFDPVTKTAEQISWEEIQDSKRTPFELMSLVRCPQEEFEKVEPNFTFVSSNTEGCDETCTECSVKLCSTNTVMSLSLPGTSKGYPGYLRYPLCKGCECLFSQVNSKQEKKAMLIWMLTGEFEGKITDFAPGYFKKRFRSVARSMKKRANFESRPEEEKLAASREERKILRKERLTAVKEERNKLKEEGIYVSRRTDLVSAEELSSLVEYKRYSCSILGWTCEMFDEDAFNFLTFDHIVPIRGKAKLNKGSFCIGNIRPLCKVLNQTKSNLDDRELYRWLILLLRNYYHFKIKDLFI